MASSKAMPVGPAERPRRRAASIDPAVAALLDHIAEDLAREYVRLMKQAAQEGSGARSPREEEQEV